MKQKLKAFIIIVMAAIISLIAIYAFMRVSVAIEQARGTDLLWRMFCDMDQEYHIDSSDIGCGRIVFIHAEKAQRFRVIDDAFSCISHSCLPHLLSH